MNISLRDLIEAGGMFITAVFFAGGFWQTIRQITRKVEEMESKVNEKHEETNKRIDGLYELITRMLARRVTDHGRGNMGGSSSGQSLHNRLEDSGV